MRDPARPCRIWRSASWPLLALSCLLLPSGAKAVAPSFKAPSFKAPSFKAPSFHPPASKIDWTKSYETARLAAGERKAPIVIAVLADAERSSSEYLKTHLRSPVLAGLAKHSVNVFCSRAKKSATSGVSAKDQQACHRAVRKAVFGESEDGWIRPQFVFLNPDGAVLAAVAEYVTVGELEWSWAWAIRQVDDSFAHSLSEAARAPEEIRFGGKPYVGGASETAPTREELEEALEQVGKGGRAAWRNAREATAKLIWSDDPKAVEYGALALRFTRGGRRVTLLETIGKHSPRPWSKVVVRFLEDDDARVRHAAAAALGSLLEKKTFTDLGKCYRRKDEIAAVRGRVLRSQALLKPRDTALIRAIDKVITSSKDVTERMQAIVAAGSLEKRKSISSLLGRGLADASPRVRQATAYVIGRRRDEALLNNLRIVRENERDEETKALLVAAEKAVDGSSLEPFSKIREELARAPAAR